jgi:hypothetical protein
MFAFEWDENRTVMYSIQFLSMGYGNVVLRPVRSVLVLCSPNSAYSTIHRIIMITLSYRRLNHISIDDNQHSSRRIAIGYKLSIN